MTVDLPSPIATLEQQVALLSGCSWHGAAPLQGKLIRMSDGPSGVRGAEAFGGSPVAAFPAASTLANSFDTALLRRLGRQFALECKSKGVNLLLAPNFNL